MPQTLLATSRIRDFVALVLFAGGTLFGGVAAAEEAKGMTIVDLLNIPLVRDPRLAPDGEEVLFVLAEADWKENKRISQIWRASRDGGDSMQLTFGKEGASEPRWSPDGKWIAFLAQRGDDEETQIYLLPRRGGEGRRLSQHPTPVSDIAWAPDGKSLYFLAEDEKTEEEKKKEEAKDDVFAFDEDYQQQHLWRIALPEGGKGTAEAERITEGDFSLWGFEVSSSGAQVVVHRAPTPLFDDIDESEVWLLTLEGKQWRRLTENRVPEDGATFSPDGSMVLFTAGADEDFEFYFNDNLFLVPAAGGGSRLLLPDLPHDVQSARWSGDGSAIFFTANTGVRSELFRLKMSSQELTQLTAGDHAVVRWHYQGARGEHLLSIDERSRPGELWLLGQRGEPRQITHLFDDLESRYRLPRQEAIRWRGADGQEVEGLLFYPLDYREGQRSPLVVQTHGGPAASDKFGFGRWINYTQVLTARGWMVFKPNYRGSKGYGDAFLRDMVGGYYNQAHRDVMTGVDALIQRGLADPDRMVKMGWSAGGHMTNKIITFTNRFKAAASGAGAVNWISMYGQSDVRIYRTPWFGGTPWEKDAPIDVYWNHSPLKDISKVQTPTLVLVGQNDPRVPMPQSVELYRALKSNGVPTHLYVAPREPHGWRELRHELFKVNVELEWFERWALQKEYPWEEAPSEPGEGAEGKEEDEGSE